MKDNLEYKKGLLVGYLDGNPKRSFWFDHKKPTSKHPQREILPYFELTLPNADKKLLLDLEKYFNCGEVTRYDAKNCVYRVSARDDLSNKIIPFFQENKLKSTDADDFEIFVKIMALEDPAGKDFDEFRKLVAGMRWIPRDLALS